MRLTHEELVEKLQEWLVGGDGTFLDEAQPYDLAEALPDLPEDGARQVLALFEPTLAAAVVENLEYPEQYRLLDHLEPPVSKAILDQMSSDVVADLMAAVHPRQAQQIMGLLTPEYRSVIEEQLRYPDGSAGRRMSVDYISVRQSLTAAAVLNHVRKVGREAETIAYVYVTNPAGRLVGVVGLRDLLVAAPEMLMSEIMNPAVVSVSATLDQEEVASIVAQYDLVALPVVDGHGRLVGIITVDDLVDVIQEEATEDIHRLGGSAPLTETYFNTSVLQLVKKRIGWILILFVAEAYTGTVLRHFESTLEQAVALSFFIPLLIGTGGNTGSQVVATLVRGLGVGEIEFKDILRVLGRELQSGLIIGLAMGVTTFLRAYMLGVGPALGDVVGITAAIIVVWASIVAAVLPLVLHRLRIDPAVVSGPFITTLVDGTGLFIYFSLARLLLGLA